MLDKLKEIDLNNKSTIKCINTQIMSMLKYYNGSVVFSINCLERIDTIIRKYLREVNYLHITQNIHWLYLRDKYLGSGLISN